MLSDKLGYGFNTMQLEDEALYDSLLKATYFQDEPIMHLNEPHLFSVSQLAKPQVKVLLSGEGADELMGVTCVIRHCNILHYYIRSPL
jgi:asparagine synthase (glutamine-hydrolysing)